MTTGELVLVGLLVVVMCAIGGAVLQVRAIAREVRGIVQGVGADGRQTREHLTNGLNGLIDLQTVEMTALRAWMEDRPQAAVQVMQAAEALAPKPHACRFKFNSEERTNKMIRRISVCETAGCRNVHVDEEPEESALVSQD